MKSYNEWLKSEGPLFPNLGQRAIPIQGQPRQQVPGQGSTYNRPVAPAPQAQAPQQQVSLSTLAPQVQDITWHSLHDVFTRQYQRTPNDPSVGQLGQALYQAATTKNMALLQPFKQKFLNAQRV